MLVIGALLTGLGLALLACRPTSDTSGCLGLLHGLVTSDLACLRAVGKDVAVPKPYPQEFRDDVVRVARDRGEGVTIEQVAKDFGVHPMTLHKWMRRADIDEGRSPGVSATESAELREARKRIRLLEQENEVLRRAAA